MNPMHINATSDDLAGNNGIGRYVFMTGSDERAKRISQYFMDTNVLNHGRGHHLYLGALPTDHGPIDVAAISSGMGGPSLDIILNEICMLGGKRILRVGTAGSLQPDDIQVGSVVIASGAVRDDKASWDYIYREYPAMASLEYQIAAGRATKLSAGVKTHVGLVHSKSSLYARELGVSFLNENKEYMKDLKKAGVKASEMECAQLFTLASILSAQYKSKPILTGALLAIVGDERPFSENREAIAMGIQAVIDLSLETTRQMSYIDKGIHALF